MSWEIIDLLGIENDPVRAQCLASYSWERAEDWKLRVWKELVSVTARAGNDFVISVPELKDAVDEAAQSAESVVVLSGGVPMICRGLVNCNVLVRAQSLQLRQEQQEPGDVGKNPWNDAKISPILDRRERQLKVGAGPWSNIQAFTRGLIFGSKGSRSHLTQLVTLPFEERLSAAAIDGDEKLLVFSELERLGSAFIRRMKASGQTENLLQSDCPESSDTLIVPLSALQAFLEEELCPTSVTKIHVEAMAWYFRYFTATVCPFRCRFDNSIPPVKVLKCCWGDSGGACVTPQDRTAVLEAFALRHLQARIDSSLRRHQELEVECRGYVARQNSGAALLALKKMKTFQRDISNLQAQLFKLEEARAVRDSTTAFNVLTTTLQQALAVTKGMLPDQATVQGVFDGLADAQLDYEDLKIATQVPTDPELQRQLEEEYRALVRQSAELPVLPSPPTHEIRNAMPASEATKIFSAQGVSE